MQEQKPPKEFLLQPIDVISCLCTLEETLFYKLTLLSEIMPEDGEQDDGVTQLYEKLKSVQQSTTSIINEVCKVAPEKRRCKTFVSEIMYHLINAAASSPHPY